MEGPVTPDALTASYRLIVLLPLVCGILQLLAWSKFDLSGERLRLVTAASRAPTSSTSHHAVVTRDDCSLFEARPNKDDDDGRKL